MQKQLLQRNDSDKLVHVLLDQIVDIFDQYYQNLLPSNFNAIYLQPVLLILLNTFYPEFIQKLYPFQSKTGLLSKPLDKLLLKLIKSGFIYLEKDHIIIKPSSPEERNKFPRIGNLEPKFFFEFLIGYSKRNIHEIIPPENQDPLHISLQIYSIISISWAQVLHKIGIQTPALLLADTKKLVLEFAKNWITRIPVLNELNIITNEKLIDPFFKNYHACYHFLIDSYFPKAQFNI